MFTDYLSDVAERLDHVRGHVENNPKIEKLVANINANVPHKNACLLLLSSQAMGEAILAWFERHDISNFKNWLFTAAEIDRISYLAETNTSAPAAKFLQLLKPLVSDNVSLISWFSNYDSAYDAKRIEDPKTEDFFAYQAIIALRGDWSRLKLRCDNVIGEQALGQVAKYSVLRSFVPQGHCWYAARFNSNGDTKGFARSQKFRIWFHRGMYFDICSNIL
jgi:hypothetical protein